MKHVNIKTVNKRLLIAATMVAVATLPSIASAGPGNTIEATVVTSGKVDSAHTVGGASGSGSAGFGAFGKGEGRFGNKETKTRINSMVQEGSKGKISGTFVLGTDVGRVTNIGSEVASGQLCRNK
jgi:hypothetical protein